jgi:hypothetical protein
MNTFKCIVSGAAALATIATVNLTTPAVAGLLDAFKKFPECHDTKVLDKIVKRFNWAEDNTWQRGITLQTIERTRERLVQSTKISSIPRRYCRGHAILSNGKHPTVFYLIEGGQGYSGTQFNVEYCISGFDEWREFDGSCRVLRY